MEPVIPEDWLENPPPKRAFPVKLVGSGACCLLMLAGFVILLDPIFEQVFNPGKKMSPTTACLQNLKQTGLAVLLYRQDYDDHLPRAANWMDTLSPYLKDEAVYHCPEVLKSNPVGYGYAYNGRFSGAAAEKITGAPQWMVMLFETSKLTRSAHDPLVSLADPPHHAWGNNFAFLDGHAKTLENRKVQQAFTPKY